MLQSVAREVTDMRRCTLVVLSALKGTDVRTSLEQRVCLEIRLYEEVAHFPSKFLRPAHLENPFRHPACVDPLFAFNDRALIVA